MPARIEWPIIDPDQGPRDGQTIAHNLGVIADRLETVAERLDNLTGVLERVSEHLYDLKNRGTGFGGPR